MTIVQHYALGAGWITPYNIENPRTLVLGSFNPYDASDTPPLDYYYGRRSNHFWQSIARIKRKSSNYFFDTQEGLQRKLNIMRNRFCCMDVINQIEFTCDNDLVLHNYLQNEVFSKFLDQRIWTTKTKRKTPHPITLRRSYNTSIINHLDTSLTINKVIHTMGSNKIPGLSEAKHKEQALGNLGFRSFIDRIAQVCEERNIEFVLNSLSPSDYAVKTLKTNTANLDEWLARHLNLTTDN
jgi:hypothetical protein